MLCVGDFEDEYERRGRGKRGGENYRNQIKYDKKIERRGCEVILNIICLKSSRSLVTIRCI